MADDDVVVIAHRDALASLEKQWGPETPESTA
jgi:hypothetical protein